MIAWRHVQNGGIGHGRGAEGIRRKLSAGEVLMTVGDTISHIPVVLSGSLRILAQNAHGQERFLYHIMPGESCAMSLNCCSGMQPSPVVAIVEEDAELVTIPARFMEEWMVYPEWRRFVSDTQNQRFNELLETIEVVAFTRLDEQLWTYLVKRAQATGEHTLKVTHQEIAQELNSLEKSSPGSFISSLNAARSSYHAAR